MTPGLAKCMCHFGFVVAAGVMLSLPAEAVTITVGEDKTIVAMDHYEATPGDDPNNSWPRPEGQTTSSGNTAYVGLRATPGHAGLNTAYIGLDISWAAGSNTWEAAMTSPVVVTIDMSYEVEANWVMWHGGSGASIAATSPSPFSDLSVARIGWACDVERGTRSGCRRVAVRTTPGEIQGQLLFTLMCQAFSTPEEAPYPLPGTVHTSRAKVTINSIAFEFLKPNFAVVDVISRYCSKQQHVYFLNGVPLDVAFKAVVNWNGKRPSHILYKKRGAYTLVPDNEPCFFDVGAFAAGDALTATAIAADGTQSDPIRVNCDVISVPNGILPFDLYVVPLTRGLKYATGKSSFNSEKVIDLLGSPVSAGIPWFGGNGFKFSCEVSHEYSITGDGLAKSVVKTGFDAGGNPKTGTRLGPLLMIPKVNVGGKAGVVGQEEMRYSSIDGWRLNRGEYGIRFAGRAKSPDIPWPVLPVFYGNCSFVWDNTLAITVIHVFPTYRSYTSTWSGDAQIAGAVGIGLPNWAGAEVFAHGGPYWTLEMYPGVWPPHTLTAAGGKRLTNPM